MKAAAFVYVRTANIEEAVSLLTRHSAHAKLLAGGQSLLPMLNLRVTAPELLIDIGGIANLRGIRIDGDIVRIGALTRHTDLLMSPAIPVYAPLLAKAVPHIAHPAIRNRGTIGGSLAYADPAAELPACVVALGTRSMQTNFACGLRARNFSHACITPVAGPRRVSIHDSLSET